MSHDHIAKVGSAVAILGMLWLLSGCSGCHEQALDAVDERLSADPMRAGKVGTWTALEVAKRARTVSEHQMNRGRGLCEIGWTGDHAVGVDFWLEIAVSHTSYRRQWVEHGKWRRDREGRFFIEVDVEFSDGDHSSGSRKQRIFSDDEGFWEWLGPELVVRHKVDSEVEQRWKREFSGRFPGLLALTSSTWQEAPQSEDGSLLWMPGGEHRLCGPSVGDSEAVSWRPLLGARVAKKQASVSAREHSQGDKSQLCRHFHAEYRLQSGAVMSVDYQECSADPPESLERPEIRRSVDVGRDRQRSQMASRLGAWIREELVDTVEWKESP